MKRFLFAFALALFATSVALSLPPAWAGPASSPEATSQDLLRRADDSVAAGNLNQAIDDYTSAIRLRLDDPEAWFKRGKALTAAGRFRDAIDDLDQAIRLRPSFTEAYLERGFAYGQGGDFARGIHDLDRVTAAEPLNARALTLRGDARARVGQLDLAIHDFSAALLTIPVEAPAEVPNLVRLLLARSHIYALLGRNREALDDRNQAVTLAPQNPDVYLARGGSLHEAGLHEQGFADRTEAIRLRPDFPEAWYARGSAYFLLGDYRNASHDLQECLRLNPNYAEARDVLEKARIEIAKEALGLKPEPSRDAASPANANATPIAQASYLRTIVLHPALPPASEALSPASSAKDSSLPESSAAGTPALPESASGDPVSESSAMTSPATKSADAKSTATKFAAPTRLGSNAAVSIAAVADVGSRAPAALTEPIPVFQDSEHAKAAPKTAIATARTATAPVPGAPDSHYAVTHNQRGRELIQQGKYGEAVDELTAALKAQPEFAQALNARGFAYVLLKDWPHATADLDAALRLDPQYANAYHNRAVARYAAGDKSGSAADEAKSKELTATK